MKKILLTGALILSIGTIGLARGMHNGMGNGHGRGGCGSYGGGYHNQMIDNNPELQKSWITIQEKNLEIKKELIKNSPDWKKVEKLNSEIASEQAKIRTARTKYMREYQVSPR